MATARKCDICGSLYEMYNTKGKEPNALSLIQEYKCNVGDGFSYTLLKRFDCCPECMKSIINHINSRKTQVKE